MNEDFPKKEETLEEKMERLGQRIREDADSGRFKDFTFEDDYNVCYDTETGRITVTGPAGYSMHDARPAGNEAINDLDGSGMPVNPQANRLHLEAVQRMYDQDVFSNLEED